MDYFNCEHCNDKTWFEDSYQSVTERLGGGSTTRLFRIATVCEVDNDCICIPCGKFYNSPLVRKDLGLPPQLLAPEYSDWFCDRYAAKKSA